MEITTEQRRELLESHNDLRTALQTIWECNDIWLSDVSKLETLMIRLQRTLAFERPQDGHPHMNFVLAEDNQPAPKKRGRPKKTA
jgi:hypothetical protein